VTAVLLGAGAFGALALALAWPSVPMRKESPDDDRTTFGHVVGAVVLAVMIVAAASVLAHWLTGGGK
jgi:hypothetical protein